MSPTDVVVGRVGRAHGLRGEVMIEVRTDSPAQRFAVATGLRLDNGTELAIASSRPHGRGWLVSFEGFPDRTAVEALRGQLLYAQVDPQQVPDEPDTYFDRQLVGLQVRDADERDLGLVREVLHLPGHDLLAVDYDGREVLVPFVREITIAVDLDAGVIVVDPPAGLFGDEE